MNYLSRITRSEEDVNSSAKLRVFKKAKIDTDRSMYELEGEVASIEDELEAAKNSDSFNFQSVVELTIKLNAAKETLAAATTVQAELFAEDTAEA